MKNLFTLLLVGALTLVSCSKDSMDADVSRQPAIENIQIGGVFAAAVTGIEIDGVTVTAYGLDFGPTISEMNTGDLVRGYIALDGLSCVLDDGNWRASNPTATSVVLTHTENSSSRVTLSLVNGSTLSISGTANGIQVNGNLQVFTGSVSICN